MEEPFTILPQQDFCDKIYDWCTEMVSWRPGDNGVVMNEYAQIPQYVNGGAATNGDFEDDYDR